MLGFCWNVGLRFCCGNAGSVVRGCGNLGLLVVDCLGLVCGGLAVND